MHISDAWRVHGRYTEAQKIAAFKRDCAHIFILIAMFSVLDRWSSATYGILSLFYTESVQLKLCF